MKVGIGSDHRGLQTKERVAEIVSQCGHEVIDMGTFDHRASDYPDFAYRVAQAVQRGEVDRGILICGTGIGMSIAANKVPGIRAALCHDSLAAEMSRRHNDANVLCLPGDMMRDQLLERMVRKWLETDFEGGRHARRVDKIRRIEAGQAPDSQPNP